MFVLERLSDDDIRKIVVQAVERVSETAHPKETALPPSSPVSAVEIEILDDDDDDPKDVASSQPDIEEPLAQPSSSTQVSTQASASSGQTDVTDASGEGVTPVQFPAYPHFTPKVLSTIVALSTGDARTALSPAHVVLHPAYEGTFDARSSVFFVPEVRWPGGEADPAGRGRRRSVTTEHVGRSEVRGGTVWGRLLEPASIVFSFPISDSVGYVLYNTKKAMSWTEMM